MTKESDDLEAVRTLVSTLKPFEKVDQERIIRWSREKLGLSFASPGTTEGGKSTSAGTTVSGGKDIRTFVAEKNPTSDNQFAATVAYYYRFEAPDTERKETITQQDLQDACRKAGRDRLKKPDQTLRNAQNVGFLDKAGRGAFSINSVGENLVAMTLPGKSGGGSQPKRKGKPKKTEKTTPKRKSTKQKSISK